ncbi:MAG TPA: hypothetical protein VFZ01_15755 [Geminicoccaceae bacterium]
MTWLRLLLALLGLGSGPIHADEPPTARFSAERCAALIRLFDRIVVNRFDHRLLGIEAFELRAAERLRSDAEGRCGAGQIWLGVHAIEDALIQINVVPDLPGPGRGP